MKIRVKDKNYNLAQKDKALAFLLKKEASNTNYIFSGHDIYDLIEVVDKEWQG